MKFILIFFLIFLIQNCSFDNKSGIWKNEKASTKKNIIFKDFKSINISNKSFKKTIPINKDFKFTEINAIENYNWKDIYYNQSNNFSNFSFNENYKLIFKSKKITRYEVDKNLLFENNNVILTDIKGNIFIFSINENKLISVNLKSFLIGIVFLKLLFDILIGLKSLKILFFLIETFSFFQIPDLLSKEQFCIRKIDKKIKINLILIAN